MRVGGLARFFTYPHSPSLPVRVPAQAGEVWTHESGGFAPVTPLGTQRLLPQGHTELAPGQRNTSGQKPCPNLPGHFSLFLPTSFALWQRAGTAQDVRASLLQAEPLWPHTETTAGTSSRTQGPFGGLCCSQICAARSGGGPSSSALRLICPCGPAAPFPRAAPCATGATEEMEPTGFFLL